MDSRFNETGDAPGRPLGRALVLDASVEFRTSAQSYLQQRGVETYTAKGVEDAQALLSALKPDITTLDLDLPGIDALGMLESLAGAGTLCLAVSSRGQLSDRLQALAVGADDFVAKPVDLEELYLRVRNILAHRRVRTETATSPVLDLNGVKVDLLTRSLVSREGRKAAELTELELSLLRVLTANMDRIVSKDELSEATHGRSFEPSSRSIDVAVSRLRIKLRSSAVGVELRSVRQAGYMLTRDRRFVLSGGA